MTFIIPLFDENPTELKPIITVCLIVTFVLIFILLSILPSNMVPDIIRGYGIVPAALFKTDQVAILWPMLPVQMTLVSSIFIHNSWLHLFGNIIYLVIFGNNIEDATGHFKFTLFFLLCGLVAALTYALLNEHARSPMIGASGAISGVLGAYLILYPRARILVLIRFVWRALPIYLPAILVLLSWMLIQLFSAIYTDTTQGGVSFVAHIAGFTTGIVLIPIFKSKRHKLFGERQARVEG